VAGLVIGFSSAPILALAVLWYAGKDKGPFFVASNKDEDAVDGHYDVLSMQGRVG
jgi:hypothetical protein